MKILDVRALMSRCKTLYHAFRGRTSFVRVACRDNEEFEKKPGEESPKRAGNTGLRLCYIKLDVTPGCYGLVRFSGLPDCSVGESMNTAERLPNQAPHTVTAC